jgi:hypothetical protein
MVIIRNEPQHFLTCAHLLKERGWTLLEPVLDGEDWRVEATKENLTVCCKDPSKIYAIKKCMEMAT